MFGNTLFSSFLSVHLNEQYDVNDEQMGYYIMFDSAAYLPSALLLPIIFRRVPGKLQFIICFLVTAVGQSMIGTSEILHYPEKLGLILTGMFISGFIISINFIQVLPEVMSETQIEYKIIDGANPELDGILSDTQSAIYDLFIKLGALLGPIVGAALYNEFGYRRTMDVWMISLLVISLIYIIFNCGCSLFKKNKNKLEQLQKLKELSE